MFSLFRPYIFTLDPEAAHDLAIKSLKLNFIPKSFFQVEDEEMLSIITPPPELLWVPNEVPQGIAVNMAQMFRRFAESVRGGVDAGPDFEEAANRQHTLGFLEKASAEKSWMKIS